MKTVFLTLVAALGIALGTASLSRAAHAKNVYLYPPSEGRG
jgi:hypothetical protein